MSNRSVLIVLILLFCVILFRTLSCQCSGEKDSLKLRLEGVVTGVDFTHNFNNFNIFKVKVLRSNIDHFDPRPDAKHYYCIIKDGQAEIYQLGANDTEIGDTIYINTKREYFVNRSKNNIVSIRINGDDRFYRYIAKKHQRF